MAKWADFLGNEIVCSDRIVGEETYLETMGGLRRRAGGPILSAFHQEAALETKQGYLAAGATDDSKKLKKIDISAWNFQLDEESILIISKLSWHTARI